MPTVQTYGPRKVESGALPGARKSAGETPTSLGVGLEAARAQTQQVIGGVAGAIARLGAERFVAEETRARDHANSLAVLTSRRQLGDWVRLHVHDPEQGVFHTVKGKDAVGMASSVLAGFDQEANRIQAGLNPEQRDAFQPVLFEERDGLARGLDSYATVQTNAYEVAETHAALVGSQQTAIANIMLDPLRVLQELAATETIVNTFADHDGVGPAVRAFMLTDARTKIHAGVIEQQLAVGEDQAAQRYFEKFKDQLAPEVLPQILNKLESGSTAGKGLRAAELIWQQQGPHGESDPIQIDQMETAARTQFADDPKALTATIHYLRERKDGITAARRERQEAIAGTLWQAVNQGATLAQIHRTPAYLAAPGALQLQVSKYVVDQAEDRANRVYTLGQREEASATHAASAAARAEKEKEREGWAMLWHYDRPDVLSQMTDNQVLALTPDLGVDHVNRLMEQKRKYVASDAKVLEATMDRDLFNGVAESAGLHPFKPNLNEAQKSTLGQLENAVMTAIDLEQQRKSGPLSRSEKETIAQRIVDRRVMVDRWGSNPDGVPTAAVVNPTDRAKAYVPLERVSEQHLTEWVNAVRSHFPSAQRLSRAEILSQYRDRIQRAHAAAVLGLGVDEETRRLEGR